MRQRRRRRVAPMLILLSSVTPTILSTPSSRDLLSSSSRANAVPNIRDNFCKPSDVLEFAILCDSLYGLHLNLDASQSESESQPHHLPNYEVHFHNDEFWIGMSETKLIVAFGGSRSELQGDNVQGPLGPVGGEFLHHVVHRNETGGLNNLPVLVHEGFNRILQSSYDEIRSIIMPLLKQGLSPKASSNQQTVYFIGHAVGGARALLFGTYFAFHHPTIATYVQTFGQPRCGNLGFKIFLESIRNLNVWRIVNRQDPVIRGPFTNYYHAGHLLWRRDTQVWTTPDQEYAYEAFFRTVGSPQLGLAGIDDLSIAIAAPGESLDLHDHLLSNGVIEWLESAVSNPDQFPADFERLEVPN